MQIEEIWVSQRKLRCPEQLAGMIETLADDGLFILNRLEDDTIQVEDGHHHLYFHTCVPEPSQQMM